MNYSTYCMEDNKIRLYVGRVPRDEYLKLKADGWTSTPKQNCDFVATWTPSRADTARDYSDVGEIEDEDQGPDERAADRAERFSGYLDKRLDEATGHADRFDAGPQAHGFQSYARAVRSADRHDKHAGRAVSCWEKAEYWQSRTAGVISHALYASRPDVRMGRIKVLEADLRRFEQSPNSYPNWITHTRLRLAYENQMLEAQGGRAAFVEMIPGGWLYGQQITKVNKSNATGRVVSVIVRDKNPSLVNHYGNPFPDGVARVLSHQIETERLKPDAYRAPTDEERKAFHDAKKEAKKNAPKAEVCPLVNPTDEDAQRLQDRWNEIAKAELEESHKRRGYALADFEPSEVLRITQDRYSSHSKGAYCSCGTRTVFKGGIECGSYYSAAEKLRAKHGREVCMIRRTSGGNYQASRVIILTDKPQKPLPVAVWEVVAETVNA